MSRRLHGVRRLKAFFPAITMTPQVHCQYLHRRRPCFTASILQGCAVSRHWCHCVLMVLKPHCDKTMPRTSHRPKSSVVLIALERLQHISKQARTLKRIQSGVYLPRAATSLRSLLCQPFAKRAPVAALTEQPMQNKRNLWCLQTTLKPCWPHTTFLPAPACDLQLELMQLLADVQFTRSGAI